MKSGGKLMWLFIIFYSGRNLAYACLFSGVGS